MDLLKQGHCNIFFIFWYTKNWHAVVYVFSEIPKEKKITKPLNYTENIFHIFCRSQMTVSLHTFLSSALIQRTADSVSKATMLIITSKCIPETEEIRQTHQAPCRQGGISHRALPPLHPHPHCPWRLPLANLQPLSVLLWTTKNLQHLL